MSRKIEFIPVTDPLSMKSTLEGMINDGWEIKGFVNFPSGASNGESFALLERESEPEKPREQTVEVAEPLRTFARFIKPLKKKEISISLGGS